ncbi:MAG: GNAT family N-acetyltransferase [Flavobacteriales bacterium]|nr:GNAT family N-acetyltransferase [Flavobacteriales bacterium]
MFYSIIEANSQHHIYATAICKMMAEASKIRGTGIAKREPEYICRKMNEGKAVIALDGKKLIGFCYIESWEKQKYVANSGLIVHPEYRKTGLAKKIKQSIFDLSKQKFPDAKLFGITTSMAVMKINSDLGYQAVTFSELTKDEAFWNGCKSCSNYDILQRTNKSMCLCTGMICDLKAVSTSPPKEEKSRWKNFKRFLQFRAIRLKQKSKQFPKLKTALKDEK